MCVHMCWDKIMIFIHTSFNSKECTHFFKRGKVKASPNRRGKHVIDVRRDIFARGRREGGGASVPLA